jgi:hypothetical protein
MVAAGESPLARSNRMNIRLNALAASLAALALCLPFPASADNIVVVPAADANKQAYVTNKGINWYTSLEDAKAEAKKEGKLVFWLHMLGTIDGAT